MGHVEGAPQGVALASPPAVAKFDPTTGGQEGKYCPDPQGGPDGVPQSLGVARPRPALGVGSVGGVFAGFGLDGSGPVPPLRSGAERPTALEKDDAAVAPMLAVPELKPSIASLRLSVGV